MADQAQSPSPEVGGERTTEWARWITRRNRETSDLDWACAECRPYSHMLRQGFRCVYHDAWAHLNALASSTPVSAGREEPGEPWYRAIHHPDCDWRRAAGAYAAACTCDELSPSPVSSGGAEWTAQDAEHLKHLSECMDPAWVAQVAARAAQYIAHLEGPPVSSGGVPTIPTWEEVMDRLNSVRELHWRLGKADEVGTPSEYVVAGDVARIAYEDAVEMLQQVHTQALAGGEDTKLLDWQEANPRAVGYATGCLGAASAWTYTTPEFEVLPAASLRDALRAARTSRPTTEGGDGNG